jgi:hypothetical protein
LWFKITAGTTLGAWVLGETLEWHLRAKAIKQPAQCQGPLFLHSVSLYQVNCLVGPSSVVLSPLHRKISDLLLSRALYPLI